jgi:corrinoid protein of di/trimethylamine methyltransferase
MAQESERLHQELSDGVVAFDEDKVIAASHEVIAQGLDAYEAIDHGLAHGMERAGKLFEDEEYFVPEILLCADAMYAGINLLQPHIPQDSQPKKGRVVIGVVEGDTHDIGKNLVRIMLQAAGFEMHDLGRDVAPHRFVDKALEVQADIIALSTLMTTTMDGMAEVIRILNRENVRGNFKVVVGGAPLSHAFARKIGADGYAANAIEATKLAHQLVEIPVSVAEVA